MRHKAGADFGSKEQIVAVVVTNNHGIERIARRVAADDKLLALLILYLTQVPLRRPGSYRESKRFAITPSRPRAFAD